MPRLKALYAQAKAIYPKLPPSHELSQLKAVMDFSDLLFGDEPYSDSSFQSAIRVLESTLKKAEALTVDKSKLENLPVDKREFKELSLDEQRRYADAAIRAYEPGNLGPRTAKEVLGWDTPEYKAAHARAKEYEDEAYRRALEGTIEDYQPVATEEDIRLLAPYVRLSDVITAAALPRLDRLNSKLMGNTVQVTPLDQEGKTNHVLHSIVQSGLLRAQEEGKALDVSPHLPGRTITTAYKGEPAPIENLAYYPGGMPSDFTPESMGAAAEIAYLVEYQNLGGTGETGHLYNIMVNDYHYTSAYVSDELEDGSIVYTITSTQLPKWAAKFYDW